jgi:hypothetical protein
MKKIIPIMLLFDIVISLVLMRNDLESDGYLEIGFPFTVFRVTNGKMVTEKNNGFLWEGLFFNIFIIIVISFLFVVLIRKFRKI